MAGLFGIIIAAIVNVFLQSSGLYFAISVISVLVFAGFITWETQAMKNSFELVRRGEAPADMLQYEWALSLYISIIGLFRSILSLTSSR